MPSASDHIEAERRAELVAATFERVGYRPGSRLDWGGDSVLAYDDAVTDRVTGVVGPWCWEDGSAGDRINAAIWDPACTDEALTRVCLLAAAGAAASNEVHELCEWMHLDGHLIWDPHPSGSTFERNPPVTIEVRHSNDPAPAPRCDGGYPELVEVPRAAAIAAAEALCERVSLEHMGEFSVGGDYLVHTAIYADRNSGEPREFTWSREVLGDLYVPEDGDRDHQLDVVLVETMMCTAAASAVHEISEWLTLDGVRVFDPHPERLCFTQIEQLLGHVRFHTGPALR